MATCGPIETAETGLIIDTSYLLYSYRQEQHLYCNIGLISHKNSLSGVARLFTLLLHFRQNESCAQIDPSAPWAFCVAIILEYLIKYINLSGTTFLSACFCILSTCMSHVYRIIILMQYIWRSRIAVTTATISWSNTRRLLGDRPARQIVEHTRVTDD